jgi:UDP-GlcNAc:undecaprenyl-phosphate GlcNAc-1-phosphate transferase
MTLILGLIAGIFVTMVLIPPLAKMAPILGLEDPPGERKVHKYPIPRVGGIAIAIGVLLPVIMWLPLTG